MNISEMLEKVFTIEDAETLYKTFGVATIYKNGKLAFMEEKNGN